jgi:hypothetical protein
LFGAAIGAPAAACTVQTEDDSVPGSGHGWGGLYYVYTPYAGYVEDGHAEPFVPGFSLVDHSFTLEGVVGLGADFYVKADVPYAIDVTAETEYPDDYRDVARGLGDVSAAAKWAFVNSKDGPRAAALAGASFPTGNEEEGFGAGVVVPKVMFVGGAAVPRGRLYGGVSYAYVPSTDGDDAGDRLGYHATYDLRLSAGGAVTAPLEVIGAVTARDKTAGETVEHSGSHVLAVSPGVTVTFAQTWTVCGGVIVPVLESGWGYDYDYAPHVTVFYGF